MRLVIDTNRIIAALVKNGASRTVLLYEMHEFFVPEFALDEIKKYELEIIDKAEVTKEEFDTLLEILLSKINIVKKSEYSHRLEEASQIISDKKDITFIALALTIENEGIWSEDKDFERQNIIKIWKTHDLFQDGQVFK